MDLTRLVKTEDLPEANLASSASVSAQDLVFELSKLIKGYLADRPFIGLSTISGRCQVSESTLRRIYNCQIKTLPTPSTVMAIVSYISEETDVAKLIELNPGLIANYLKENFPHAAEFDCEVSEELNRELADSIKYLVYKLCNHTSGCSEEQVMDLVGKVGIQRLEELLRKDLITQRGGRYYSNGKRFSLAPELFKDKFQFMSQFIKVEERPGGKLQQNVFSNYSSSVNQEAYNKIMKIQKQALKKIRETMVNPNSEGDLHIFALSAIDTIEY
ncbi:MAG: hypothetical protein HRT45_10675 [Bdellovibrionales bacterium]|nr:hypothetical protein [Bdellovibrionales bacterium]